MARHSAYSPISKRTGAGQVLPLVVWAQGAEHHPAGGLCPFGLDACTVANYSPDVRPRDRLLRSVLRRSEQQLVSGSSFSCSRLVLLCCALLRYSEQNSDRRPRHSCAPGRYHRRRPFFLCCSCFLARICQSLHRVHRPLRQHKLSTSPIWPCALDTTPIVRRDYS